MTSKEALELLELILLNHSSMLVINDKRFEYFNVIKEHLEVLEKENKKWREIVGCDLCEALGREILLEENEKLKKAIEILKDHVQFKLVPIVSNDPILEGAYHFGIKIDKYGYYATLPKIEAELLKEVLGE